MIKEAVKNRFLKYVQINSETRNEKAFAEHLKNELIDLGFQVTMDDAGSSFGGNCGNLIAYMPGDASKDTFFLSGHMDTVSPGNDIEPIEIDGVIYSKGDTILGGDDKAGLAAIVTGVESLLKEGKSIGPLELLFTVGEEGGLHGSGFLDVNQLKSKKGFILDSSRDIGEIINKGPGQGHLKATIFGKAAHAGVCPENGISAVAILAEAVQHMKLLRIDEETTANIGKVNGGTATNIVMPELHVVAEARSLNVRKLDEQLKHMKETFINAADKLGGSVEVDIQVVYPSFFVDPSTSVVKLATEAYKSLGIEATTTSTGGGSDANTLNGKGLEVINLGIHEQKSHTIDEAYAVDDLVTMTHFVKALIQQH